MQLFFLVTLFRVGFLFQLQLTLRQLIQPDLESRFVVSSQLGPSIQSGSSPSAGLQMVTQSTHLSKDCYPQLVSNPHHSEIRPPKQLNYRRMPLHPIESIKFSQQEVIKVHHTALHGIYMEGSKLFIANKSTFCLCKTYPKIKNKVDVNSLNVFESNYSKINFENNYQVSSSIR